MNVKTVETTSLQAYIERDPRLVRVYENYRPNTALIEKIREALPSARVLAVSAYWCSDCLWNVPKLARIAEHLPEWEFEVYSREDERVESLGIMAIPTIIVYLGEGELGRIVENPMLESIEADLLEFALNQKEALTNV